MAITDVRMEVLDIINEVQRKLGISSNSSAFATRSLTTVLLDLLNDVIDELSDYGDWPQMFREVDVTAVSSTGTYEIAVSSQVKNIHEVAWDSDAGPLEVRTIEEIRRLQRTSSLGTPRQFAVIDTSGVNPRIRVYPIPGSAEAGTLFDVAYYKKPSLYANTSANTSAQVALPSRVVVQGLYAKALLEEAGGEPTKQYQAAYAEYLRMRKEHLNRMTADTGTDIYFTPTGGWQ